MVLHCAMALPATRKTATEEDRGEDNKDPDWLIEQSIARQVAGGVVTLCNGDWKLLRSLQKVKLSSTSCNGACNKNVARQVADVTCYTRPATIHFSAIRYISRYSCHDTIRNITCPSPRISLGGSEVCTADNPSWKHACVYCVRHLEYNTKHCSPWVCSENRRA